MHPLVDLVKEKEVLMPCENPIIIENNGRKFAVPCGKCLLCLEKKLIYGVLAYVKNAKIISIVFSLL